MSSVRKMSDIVYNLLFRRSSTFTLLIVGSAFFFERGLDVMSDKIFNSINEGKLWKDIEPKYLAQK